MKKERYTSWLNIDEFYDYRPLFYVGLRNGLIDTAEVFKYKGDVPEYISHFLPLETYYGVRDKPRVALYDWWIDNTTFFPTEVLRGRIGTGHPYLYEGEIIRSSAIVKKHTNMYPNIVETRNTMYVLHDERLSND